MTRAAQINSDLWLKEMMINPKSNPQFENFYKEELVKMCKIAKQEIAKLNDNIAQNGYCYRFTLNGSTFSWQLIKDSDVTAALQRLQTAEGKIGNIETFDEEIASFKTDTEEELSSLKTKTTTLETTLGDKVDVVKATTKLKSHPVVISSGDGITFEMEKYFTAVNPELGMKAKRILELNVDHKAFLALDRARLDDPEKAKKMCEVLFNQALLIAGLPIDDPSGYTDIVCSFF